MLQDSVEELRSVLSRIEQAIGGPISKAPRAQILKSIAFLDGQVGKSIDELIMALEAAKPQPKAKATKPPSAKPRIKKPKEPVRVEVVEQYIDKLKLSETSLDGFASLISAMKADKMVRLDELKLIVPRYSGDTSAIKSKPAALGVIQRAFDVRWSLSQHSQQSHAAQ